MVPHARLLALLLTLTACLAALAPGAASASAGHGAHAAKAKPAKQAKQGSKAKQKAKAKAKARRKARAKRRAIDPQLPKAWAKRYHVRKAAGDPDRDGLSNVGEYKAGLNPKRADTDADGVKDGDEHPGTITALSPAGATIALFGGGSLSADFSDTTLFTCDAAESDLDQLVDDAGDAFEDLGDDTAANQLGDDGDDTAANQSDDEDGGDDPADEGDDSPSVDEDADAPAALSSLPCTGLAVGDRVYEAVTSGGGFDTFDVLGAS